MRWFFFFSVALFLAFGCTKPNTIDWEKIFSDGDAAASADDGTADLTDEEVADETGEEEIPDAITEEEEPDSADTAEPEGDGWEPADDEEATPDGEEEIGDDTATPDDDLVDEDLVEADAWEADIVEADTVDVDMVEADTFDDWVPDTTDVQPDLDIVDVDVVDVDTYDDWVPDTTDVQPDLDIVDVDAVDVDTYDDWVSDTTDVQPDLDVMDEDTVVPDDDVAYTGVLCTGQTKCYNNTTEITCPAPGSDFYGQDAQYASLGYCTPRSYSISGTAGNDIVTDNNTGLIWQRTLSTSTYTWADAITYCENLTYGGQTDWRLPTRKELATLPDYGRYNPAIDTAIFPGTKSNYYWSSSSSVGNISAAWVVYFYNGIVYDYGKTNTYYARCVRGNTISDGTFIESTVSGKVIVTDSATGLIWEKEYIGTVNWQNALSYCENLDYGGATDWRLPNINELKTLIDDAIYGPASSFPGMPRQYFWSSSSFVSNTSRAWTVNFNYGNVADYNKTDTYYARCVRSP